MLRYNFRLKFNFVDVVGISAAVAAATHGLWVSAVGYFLGSLIISAAGTVYLRSKQAAANPKR